MQTLSLDVNGPYYCIGNVLSVIMNTMLQVVPFLSQVLLSFVASTSVQSLCVERGTEWFPSNCRIKRKTRSQ